MAFQPAQELLLTQAGQGILAVREVLLVPAVLLALVVRKQSYTA